MKPQKVYIGIGSNLGDPLSQVADAFLQLDGIRKTRLLQQSSLYRSQAMGDIEQDDFINAVACVETTLQPTALLLELQAIEHAFYRQRDNALKWGPRTLDLDIILYGNLQQHDSHLTIPHPELQNRLFVLQPMKEIAGDLYIAGLGSIDYLIEHAPALRISRLGS
jgi:2-amino-4-hydroxy-6-hydroxymethyldihydropteridine diphosphokinase